MNERNNVSFLESTIFLTRRFGNQDCIEFVTGNNGTRNRGIVNKWLQGEAYPTRSDKIRVLTLFGIFKLIEQVDDAETASMWLLGADTSADTPLETNRIIELTTNPQTVKRAARNFKFSS